MFLTSRHLTTILTFGARLILPAQAISSQPGDITDTRARCIVTFFPSRVTGSPVETLPADYIRQQFQQMGYSNDIQIFDSRCVYIAKDNRKNWYDVMRSIVIAAHEGKASQRIITIVHLDTYAVQSDVGSGTNLGGLTLQGIDDNAAGVDVVPELVEKLKNVSTQYGIRFITTDGEEEGGLNVENILKRVSAVEKKNMLLAINLDSLIVGDRLCFNNGKKTPEAMRRLTRDRTLAIAHSRGIVTSTNSDLNKGYPKGTGCCNDVEVFDDAGIAALSVGTVNWSLGKKDGYQQCVKNVSFPAGNSWHDIWLDNQQHIDKALPGRIEHRSHGVVRIMLPLAKELAKVGRS